MSAGEDRVATWAARVASPRHCVTVHRAYVGVDHILSDRTSRCRLGSEVPRSVVEGDVARREQHSREVTAWFRSQR